ncbi:hypothetical protein BT69DRAFT_1263334 [Atractiella rhizophila]|nr:hypothetical protein BT69DRAFT_1263334 [Atractiella rhizophila]
MGKNKRHLEEEGDGLREGKRVKVEGEGQDGVVMNKVAPEPSRGPSNTTIYVSSIPPTLTSPQLSSLFSSLAPVRSAFVVSKSVGTTATEDQKPERQSRGFGYVKFVLKEDAERCLEDWANGPPDDAISQIDDWSGSKADLKKIKVSLAKQKPTLEERRKKTSTAEQSQNEQVGGDAGEWKEKREWGKRKREEGKGKIEQLRKDQDASRTVVLLGFGMGVASGDAHEEEESDAQNGPENGAPAGKGEEGHKREINNLYKKTRKLGTVEDIRYPVYFAPVHRFISSDATAEIRFATPQDAQYAVSKMHNHVFKGYLLSGCLKSDWDKVSRERIDERRLQSRKGEEKQGDAGGARSGRVIVRNLPFDISKADLLSVFAPHGAIHSITLPTKASDSSSSTSGYAFVHFISHSSAEIALERVNGTRVYAGCAQERALESEQAMGKKGRDRKKEIKSSREGRGREVAVDWAVDKEKWKQLQRGQEQDIEGMNVDEDEVDEGDEVEDGEDEEEEGEESDLDPVALEDEDEDEGEEVEEEVEPKIHEEKGTTLFVRNLSFESKEEELYDLFKSFGPLRYARIAMDPTKNRSRGTGFVCFWNKDDADEVVKLSDKLQNEWKIEAEASTNGKKMQRSILQPDVTSNVASRLNLGGRVLAVSLAVSREKADHLREERDKKGKKSDRRNLYLMKEGVIHSGHPLVKSLSSSDIQARQTSFDARKNLLRSNPSLFISKTRLSVRQIPIWVNDSLLKRLSLWALKEFDKEVKSGIREQVHMEEVEDSADVRTNKKGIPLSKVVQSKICRQSDRIDATNPVPSKNPIGKSKGYGFLEMNNHQNSLKVLRFLNGNKQAEVALAEWWKEDLSKKIEDLKVKKADKKDIEKAEEAVLRWEKTKLKGGGKTLMIEFSIENSVTNKRRQEKREKILRNVNSVKPLRKVKVEESRPDKKALPMKAKKKGELIGGLIGRKRKERKSKRS